MLLHGLTENHERSLLASVQYAARLIRDCDGVLATSDGSDVLSRYTGALSAPQQKIAHDYLHRLQEQLLRALEAVGLQPPWQIGRGRCLRHSLMLSAAQPSKCAAGISAGTERCRRQPTACSTASCPRCRSWCAILRCSSRGCPMTCCVDV